MLNLFLQKKTLKSTRYDDDPDNAITSLNYLNASNYHEEENANDENFSRFSITIKLPKSQIQKQAEAESSNRSDVRLARQVLETSRMKNSSSQWLQFSGSKSF